MARIRSSSAASRLAVAAAHVHKRRCQQRRRGLAFLAFILVLGSLFAPAARPPAYALDAPIPLAPADAAVTTVANYPPLGVPEFAWSPVVGAAEYRIQFSQDIGFASRFEATTRNARFTPTDALSFTDGLWYWRVRVDTPSPPSAYSAIMSFTKQWASPENAVALVYPNDGATLDFYDKPAFAWQTVIGAAAYKFQIASSPDGFSAPRYSQTVLTASHQPAAKLSNGSYYWRVVPVDPSNREGAASAVRAFTANYNHIPTLLEPADNSYPTFTPTFRWTAVRGAQFYRLQYSTDPTFNAGVTTVDTRNTSYTPISELPNDVNYYWRVRVHAGGAIADWSAVRTFRKQWYIQPELLTPTNNYQFVSDALFSWTPVPAAASYRLEINCANSFPPSPTCGWTFNVANPFHAMRVELNRYLGPITWFWRVTPVDGSGGMGRPSATSSFIYSPLALAPQLVYPLYYYAPTAALNPREDRTVNLPVFIWHRLAFSDTQAAAYRLQVDDDPLFGSVDWTLDTENLSAAPTAAAPFTPTVGGVYYWRVRPLTSRGGGYAGEWSQKWRTRIDITRGLTPTVGASPTFLRPAHASEYVMATPALEWLPLADATSYDVQISSDPGFADGFLVDAATTFYPVHTPAVRLPYGTYYWRVRGRAGAAAGEWSAGWRFQVAGQSYWQESRTAGDPGNRRLIASDPQGDMSNPNYDLTDLYAVQAKDYWFFGWRAYPGDDMTYGLYLDLDHTESADTAGDARGLNIATIPAHRPEYAIYVLRSDGVFTASQVAIYRRTGDTWAAPVTFEEVGGKVYYSSTLQYLELQTPSTAIGMDETTGSAAVALFSARAAGGHAQDTIPSDPNVAYTSPSASAEVTTLSRFTSVSERLTLAAPPTNATGDPTVWPSVGPFFWHLPVGVFLNAWCGYQFQAALDPLFTQPVWDYTMRLDRAIYSPPSHTRDWDLTGDNTYYWRVRPAYDPISISRNHRGAWSQGWRFERQGFVPQNPRTSVTFATPTFSWDMVEGAESYDLQVDDDPGFGSPAVSIRTTRIAYTPTDTLAQARYYWRVRVVRKGNVINDWSAVQSFVLTPPEPANLSHEPAGTVARAPTLCWSPVVASAGGEAVFAAWKYRVQVSREPTFSTAYDTTDTEQACWTPTKGYDDGMYYWRVAVIDGSGRVAAFSPAAIFTKQYPLAALVSPADGSALAETPTFIWQPAEGAAKYKLEVSLFGTFSPIMETVTTNNTRYTSTRTYNLGKNYYWRVAMIDRDGKQGPFAQSTVVLDYAELQITVLGPATARPGDAVVYVITYANLGRAAAEGVRVSDALPAGVTTEQTPIWEIGRLESGVIRSVTLTATVSANAACGAVLVNVVSIASDSAESDVMNNEARTSATVICPDLVLVKAGPLTARPGQTITYTLTYNNVGLAPAANVRISDTLPAGMTSVSPLTWDLGAVNAGVTGALTFTATLSSGLACNTPLVNIGRIAAFGAESDRTNNEARAVTTVACADKAYLPLVRR